MLLYFFLKYLKYSDLVKLLLVCKDIENLYSRDTIEYDFRQYNNYFMLVIEL